MFWKFSHRNRSKWKDLSFSPTNQNAPHNIALKHGNSFPQKTPDVGQTKDMHLSSNTTEIVGFFSHFYDFANGTDYRIVFVLPMDLMLVFVTTAAVDKN